MTQITLSDGEVCDIRRLRLFELREAIKPPISGEWTYTREIGGQTVTAAFEWPDDIPPPQRPQGEIPQDGTPRWFAWIDYEYYQASLHHKRLIIEDVERYQHEIATYILQNCLNPADRERVVTVDDYNTVYTAALVPELAKEDLEREALHIFHAKFNDIPVLDALLDSDSKTLGEYDPIAVWEVQTMTAAGMDETTWAELTTSERARKIVANKIDGWMSSLQSEVDRAKRN